MLYRDLGGIKNKDGRTIKKNYLIRSANLSKINGEPLHQLEKRHLCKIIDLRTSEEASEKPNLEFMGISLCKAATGISVSDKSTKIDK